MHFSGATLPLCISFLAFTTAAPSADTKSLTRDTHQSSLEPRGNAISAAKEKLKSSPADASLRSSRSRKNLLIPKIQCMGYNGKFCVKSCECTTDGTIFCSEDDAEAISSIVLYSNVLEGKGGDKYVESSHPPITGVCSKLCVCEVNGDFTLGSKPRDGLDSIEGEKAKAKSLDKVMREGRTAGSNAQSEVNLPAVKPSRTTDTTPAGQASDALHPAATQKSSAPRKAGLFRKMLGLQSRVTTSRTVPILPFSTNDIPQRYLDVMEITSEDPALDWDLRVDRIQHLNPVPSRDPGHLLPSDLPVDKSRGLYLNQYRRIRKIAPAAQGRPSQQTRSSRTVPILPFSTSDIPKALWDDYYRRVSFGSARLPIRHPATGSRTPPILPPHQEAIETGEIQPSGTRHPLADEASSSTDAPKFYRRGNSISMSIKPDGYESLPGAPPEASTPVSRRTAHYTGHVSPIVCVGPKGLKCEGGCYCADDGNIACDRRTDAEKRAVSYMYIKRGQRPETIVEEIKVTLMSMCVPICGCEKDGITRVAGKTKEEWREIRKQEALRKKKSGDEREKPETAGTPVGSLEKQENQERQAALPPALAGPPSTTPPTAPHHVQAEAPDRSLIRRSQNADPAISMSTVQNPPFIQRNQSFIPLPSSPSSKLPLSDLVKANSTSITLTASLRKRTSPRSRPASPDTPLRKPICSRRDLVRKEICEDRCYCTVSGEVKCDTEFPHHFAHLLEYARMVNLPKEKLDQKIQAQKVTATNFCVPVCKCPPLPRRTTSTPSLPSQKSDQANVPPASHALGETSFFSSSVSGLHRRGRPRYGTAPYEAKLSRPICEAKELQFCSTVCRCVEDDKVSRVKVKCDVRYLLQSPNPKTVATSWIGRYNSDLIQRCSQGCKCDEDSPATIPLVQPSDIFQHPNISGAPNLSTSTGSTNRLLDPYSSMQGSSSDSISLLHRRGRHIPESDMVRPICQGYPNDCCQTVCECTPEGLIKCDIRQLYHLSTSWPSESILNLIFQHHVKLEDYCSRGCKCEGRSGSPNPSHPTISAPMSNVARNAAPHGPSNKPSSSGIFSLHWRGRRLPDPDAIDPDLRPTCEGPDKIFCAPRCACTLAGKVKCDMHYPPPPGINSSDITYLEIVRRVHDIAFYCVSICTCKQESLKIVNSTQAPSVQSRRIPHTSVSSYGLSNIASSSDSPPSLHRRTQKRKKADEDRLADTATSEYRPKKLSPPPSAPGNHLVCTGAQKDLCDIRCTCNPMGRVQCFRPADDQRAKHVVEHSLERQLGGNTAKLLTNIIAKDANHMTAYCSAGCHCAGLKPLPPPPGRARYSFYNALPYQGLAGVHWRHHQRPLKERSSLDHHHLHKRGKDPVPTTHISTPAYAAYQPVHPISSRRPATCSGPNKNFCDPHCYCTIQGALLCNARNPADDLFVKELLKASRADPSTKNAYYAAQIDRITRVCKPSCNCDPVPPHAPNPKRKGLPPLHPRPPTARLQSKNSAPLRRRSDSGSTSTHVPIDTAASTSIAPKTPLLHPASEKDGKRPIFCAGRQKTLCEERCYCTIAGEVKCDSTNLWPGAPMPKEDKDKTLAGYCNVPCQCVDERVAGAKTRWKMSNTAAMHLMAHPLALRRRTDTGSNSPHIPRNTPPSTSTAPRIPLSHSPSSPNDDRRPPHCVGPHFKAYCELHCHCTSTREVECDSNDLWPQARMPKRKKDKLFAGYCSKDCSCVDASFRRTRRGEELGAGHPRQ